MKLLEGKVAIITGGSGDIGFSTAKAFLDNGAKVALVARNPQKLDKAVESLKDFGEIIAIPADVSREEDVKNYVEQTVSRWGKIDVFFNNAGVIGELKPIVELNIDDLKNTIETNLLGMFIGLKHVLPVMMEQRGGSVINTSSDSAWHGQANMAPYCATKHGVNGLTKTAALEAGKYNIRVNGIMPTGVNSTMKRSLDEELKSLSNSGEVTSSTVSDIPLGRLAETHEVADLVVFLASDRSSFISGASYSIDGGQSAETN